SPACPDSRSKCPASASRRTTPTQSSGRCPMLCFCCCTGPQFACVRFLGGGALLNAHDLLAATSGNMTKNECAAGASWELCAQVRGWAPALSSSCGAAGSRKPKLFRAARARGEIAARGKKRGRLEKTQY
ncbi:unnamed protein product, partial [Ectocarpus sp. 12 AP-2014]